MDWLRRIRRRPSEEPASREQEELAPAPVERAAPGVAALFEGLQEDGGHAILDLGSASPGNFRLYSRFARQIRFADFLVEPPEGAAWAQALRRLRPPPGQGFDLVLAWNLFDRLHSKDRVLLVERLVELTSPGARLYLVVDASGEAVTAPLRFSILDVDRVSQQMVGSPSPAGPQLLPAEVERLLGPFEVVNAFTLRMGLREYMAVKRS